MSIINDFKNEFRFSAHGRTSRRNFWIYQIGLFVLGLAVAMGCGTIIGLTNAVPTSSLRSVVCMTWAILATGISPSWLQACLPPLLTRSFPLPR